MYLKVIIALLSKMSGGKKDDLTKLEPYVSFGQLYSLRYIHDYAQAHYPSHFAPALARWNDASAPDYNHKGWQKAAEYACYNLISLGLLKPNGSSEVEVSDVGRAFLELQRGKVRASKVFEKALPAKPH
jgi:hypothetical protein